MGFLGGMFGLGGGGRRRPQGAPNMGNMAAGLGSVGSAFGQATGQGMEEDPMAQAQPSPEPPPSPPQMPPGIIGGMGPGGWGDFAKGGMGQLQVMPKGGGPMPTMGRFGQSLPPGFQGGGQDLGMGPGGLPPQLGRMQGPGMGAPGQQPDFRSKLLELLAQRGQGGISTGQGIGNIARGMFSGGRSSGKGGIGGAIRRPFGLG